MADDDVLYAKFEVKQQGDAKRVTGFIFSTNREKIEAWPKSRRKKDTGIKEEEKKSLFERLTLAFTKANTSFQRSAPPVLMIAPFFVDMEADKQIRQYVKKKGKSIEAQGELETYELPYDQFENIDRLATKFDALQLGMRTLPRLFIMGLTSAYDAFVSDLIRAVLLTRPEIISSSERTFTFGDLVRIGSLDAAREELIDREIDSIMRSSHSDQVKWFESKLKIPIRDGNELWPQFIELFERRNLLAHTNGTVSARYIQVCKEQGVDVAEVKVGQELEVSAKYFTTSVDLLLEFGVKFSQVIWRKLKSDEIELADDSLSEVGYQLITDKRYKLAARILKFGVELKKHGSDAGHKRMVINYANAVKLGGDVQGALRIIGDQDWSAVSNNYTICLAAIRDDVPGVINLMKDVVASDLMIPDHFRDWPVFEPIRSKQEFVAAFEEAFGAKLFQDAEAVVGEAGSKEGQLGNDRSDGGFEGADSA